MKDDYYQRDVKPGGSQREVGEAAIGKVDRVRAERVSSSGGVGGDRRRRRRGMRAGDQKKIAANVALIKGWSLALGGVALAVVGGAFVVWLMPQLAETAAAPPTPRIAQMAAASSEELPSLIGDEAVAWVEKALDERDPEQVSRRLRLGGTPAGEAIAFLEEMGGGAGSGRSFEWLGNMNANGLTLEGVLVNYSRDGQYQNRLALLTPEDGEWKVDFAAFARLTTPSWDEFLSADGGEIVARIYASRDTYYNGPFRDERKWICYGIASPDHPELFFGYCQVGSPQAAALAGLMRKARGPQRVTVILQRVEDGEERQLEITRVLAEDWVVAPVAYDERSGG